MIRSCPPCPPQGSSTGFTLIEMAIMLIVFGIILVGGIHAMQAQQHKNNFEQAQAHLREIQQALLGFVTVNGRLPCPNSDNNGVENSPCSTLAQEGQLPWRALGVNPLDPWGHLYTYRVNVAFTTSIPIADSGNFIILNADADTLATVPVAILSHGKNGLGALAMSGDPMATPNPALPNELGEWENTTSSSNNGQFQLGAGDDLLVWLTPDVIRHQALKSGYTLSP